MVLPICLSCARGNVLCQSCEAKLSSGRINELDVEVSRVLYSIFQEEADFTHAIETEKGVVIIAKAEEVGGIIGKGGANIRTLTERLGRQVKVVGQDNLREMASALIAPARLRSIGTVHRPDGSTSFRLRIESSDRKKLRMSLGDLRKILSASSDREVELVFD